MSRQQRGTKWCFTVNDNARAWAEGLMETIYNNESEHIRYICGQLEVAPETGNLHFQGYLQLTKTSRLSWIKAHIHATAHFESQKASDNNAARDYCRKEESRAPDAEFVEFGEFSKGPGQRTDLITLRDKVKAGTSHRQLIEDDPKMYAQYMRFIDRCTSLHPPQRLDHITVKLFIGPPGAGKSHHARLDPDHYATPVGKGLWFDGYDRHGTLILDDFSGKFSKTSLNDTLRILDKYPLQVEIKGAHTWIASHTIIVTTNVHPFRWYNFESRPLLYKALTRRFDEVWYFPELFAEPEQQILPDYWDDQDAIWPARDDLQIRLPVCPRPWDYPDDVNPGTPGNQ